MDEQLTMIGLTEQPGPVGRDAIAERYAPLADPWLRVNFVSSVDGAVEVDGRSGGLSNRVDQLLLRLLRMRCHALLVGAGTLRAERYGPLRLTEPERAWRREHGLADDPTLVVVSGSLNLDPTRPAFTEAPVRPIILTQLTAPPQRRSALAATTEVITVGESSVDLPAAVDLLHRRGLTQLLCEGGPHLFAGLTAADLVDEVCLTLAAVLTGGGAGRIAAGATSPVRELSLRQVLTAGETLFLRYSRPLPHP